MAIKRTILIVLLGGSLLHAFTQEPFTSGFSMGSLGTIQSPLMKSSLSFASNALWLPDSFRYGFATSASLYFDPMGGTATDLISAEIYGAFRFKKTSCSLFFSQFSALGMYFENEVRTSIGYTITKHVALGIDARTCFAYLNVAPQKIRTYAALSATVRLASQAGFLSGSVRNIPIIYKSAIAYGDPLLLGCALETAPYKGARSGLLFELTPGRHQIIRFALAEALQLSQNCAILGGIGSSPFSVSIGLLVGTSQYGFSVNTIKQTDLGWSKGVSFAYVK